MKPLYSLLLVLALASCAKEPRPFAEVRLRAFCGGCAVSSSFGAGTTDTELEWTSNVPVGETVTITAKRTVVNPRETFVVVYVNGFQKALDFEPAYDTTLHTASLTYRVPALDRFGDEVSDL